MNKERLKEIKGARKRILDEKSFQKKCIFLYSFVELGYLDWLIEQAEKVEQLQRENEKEQKRLQNQIYETVEEKFLLEKQLQQAKAQAERYKHALKFYASRNHYSVYYDKIVLLDDGEIARKALEGKRMSDKEREEFVCDYCGTELDETDEYHTTFHTCDKDCYMKMVGLSWSDFI